MQSEQLLALLLHLHGADFAGQAEEVDEALRVVVVVKVAGGEGGDALVVERVRGGGACLDDVALVELELHFAGHIPLCGLDKRLQRLAKRGEPLALVDHLREFVAEVSL